MTTVTQAVFSRMCRTSRKTVTKWKSQGLLAMQDQLVDVEATRERFEKYRTKMPIVLTPDEAATPFRREEVTKKTVTHSPLRNVGPGPVSMLCTEIVAKLEALDWKGTFDWTPTAQAERVRKAAECVGWQAVESDLRDDGHWGGFQLRDTQDLQTYGLKEDVIRAGFGFELSAWDALIAIRDAVEPVDDDDQETIRLDLLPLLAHPWSEHDRQQ